MLKAPEKQQKVQVGKIWALFFGSLSLVFVSFIFGIFDTTTELSPSHQTVDNSCLIIAIICSLVACGMAIYLTVGLTVIQRVVLPLVIMFEGAIGVFLIAGHLSSIVEGWVDFPPGKSHKQQISMPISRAYQTHGKGGSQYIQTMPLWSNLEITQQDFTFMQTHRRSGDKGQNHDEISSQGFFCANVTVEESDRALRVLHAGSQKLPQGTVVLCPNSVHLP